MASELEKALAAQYGGNGPMFMPSTPVNDLYAGMYPTATRTNPLAPSQGGNWPQNTPQRPRSMPLTPQNYTPNIPPQIPNDPNRMASGQLPFINYPSKPPIDITVQGGGTQTASIPMPQPRPWNAPTEMDLAAIAAQEAGAMQPPVASAYAPQPAPAPAAAAASTMAQGQAPQTSWVQDLITGLGTLGGGSKAEKPQTPQQAYDAANFMAQNEARNQDRSGMGTDGYARDYFGNVVGRDAQYKGLSPSQMYDQISGRPSDNGNPNNGSAWTDRSGALRPAGAVGDGIGSSASSQESWEKLGFGSRSEMERAKTSWMAEQGLSGPTDRFTDQFSDYARQQNRARSIGVGMAGSVAPVTAGPTKAPRYSLAGAMTSTPTQQPERKKAGR